MLNNGGESGSLFKYVLPCFSCPFWDPWRRLRKSWWVGGTCDLAGDGLIFVVGYFGSGECVFFCPKKVNSFREGHFNFYSFNSGELEHILYVDLHFSLLPRWIPIHKYDFHDCGMLWSILKCVFPWFPVPGEKRLKINNSSPEAAIGLRVGLLFKSATGAAGRMFFFPGKCDPKARSSIWNIGLLAGVTHELESVCSSPFPCSPGPYLCD